MGLLEAMALDFDGNGKVSWDEGLLGYMIIDDLFEMLSEQNED